MNKKILSIICVAFMLATIISIAPVGAINKIEAENTKEDIKSQPLAPPPSPPMIGNFHPAGKSFARSWIFTHTHTTLDFKAQVSVSGWDYPSRAEYVDLTLYVTYEENAPEVIWEGYIDGSTSDDWVNLDFTRFFDEKGTYTLKLEGHFKIFGRDYEYNNSKSVKVYVDIFDESAKPAFTNIGEAFISFLTNRFPILENIL